MVLSFTFVLFVRRLPFRLLLFIYFVEIIMTIVRRYIHITYAKKKDGKKSKCQLIYIVTLSCIYTYCTECTYTYIHTQSILCANENYSIWYGQFTHRIFNFSIKSHNSISMKFDLFAQLISLITLVLFFLYILCNYAVILYACYVGKIDTID